MPLGINAKLKSPRKRASMSSCWLLAIIADDDFSSSSKKIARIIFFFSRDFSSDAEKRLDLGEMIIFLSRRLAKK